MEVTAYEDTKLREKAEIINSDSFTKDETLSLNSNENLNTKEIKNQVDLNEDLNTEPKNQTDLQNEVKTQKTLKETKKLLEKWQEKLIKSGKSEEYARDLKEWHKDSSYLTKNKDGSPKVFYHGSKADKIEVFEDNDSGYGSFFTKFSNEVELHTKQNGDELIKSYIKLKKPYRMDKITIESEKDFLKFAEFLGIEKDAEDNKINKEHYKLFLSLKEFYNDFKRNFENKNLKFSEVNFATGEVRLFDKQGHFYKIDRDGEIYDKRLRLILNTDYLDLPTINADIIETLESKNIYQEWARNEADLALIALQNNKLIEYNSKDRHYLKNLLKFKYYSFCNRNF